MDKQSIDDTQKRLQQRVGDRKSRGDYNSPQEANKQKGKRNPQSETRSYLRPGKLYVRSLDPQNRKNYYSIATDMQRLNTLERSQNRKGNTIQRLPPIKKMKLVQVDRRYSKSNRGESYKQPTFSSELHSDGKKMKLRNYELKQICSVNCKPKQKNKSRKMSKVRERYDSSRNCQSAALRDYLQSQAKSRYPSTQLRSYLSRMRQREEQEREIEEELYYHTYFGLQPQFYRLKTEYVNQIYEPKNFVSSLENYKPYCIPSIPAQQNIAEFIQNYVSFGKEINIEQLIKQQNFLVQYTPTELYFGQMEADEKQGLGVLISQKSCFEGLFSGNEKIKGVEISPPGLYRGEFYRNKKEGNGKFQWINGESYIGEWREGHRNGKGIWTNNRGDSYNGEWVKGRGQGYGIYMTEGRQYHGDFLQFKKDGWGRQKHENGDYYEGGFKKGLPEGKGVYVWSNGTRYQGQFVYGFRNGKGVLSTLDGYSYNGEFVDQKAEGLCQIVMPNGDSYQGYLRNGKKNGRGLLILGGGSKSLDGYWQNDRFLSPANF